MATGVAASPKHMNMDLLKPSSVGDSTGIRKAKGILDFFSSSPKPGCNRPSQVCEKKRGATSSEHEENTNNKKGELSDSLKICPQSSDTSDRNDAKEIHRPCEVEQTATKLVQNNSASGDSARSNKSKKPSSGKKRSLSTNKKGKTEVIEIENSESNTEEQDTQENNGKDMPQEIDYEEFVKSFVRHQTGDSTEACDRIRKDCNTVSCSEGEAAKKCMDKPDTGLSSHNEIEGETLNRTKSEQETNSQQNKPKSTKPSNAFSLLMQARSNKKRRELSDDNSNCRETGEPNAAGEKVCPAESDDTAQPEDTLEDARESDKKYPSVLNFFSKSVKPNRSDADSDGKGLVMVEVDIHQDPAEQKVTTPKRKKNGVQHRKGKVVSPHHESENEIILLGSETIEVDEEESKKIRSKKRGGSDSPPVALAAESPVLKPESNQLEQTPELATRKAFLNDSVFPSDQRVKTAQATLQFGQNGNLATNTSILAKSSKKLPTKSVDEVGDSVKASSADCNTRRSKRRRIVEHDSDSAESNDQRKKPSTDVQQNSPKQKQKKIATRLRRSVESESGSDSKEFTPVSKGKMVKNASRSRAHELLMKARQQTKKDVKQKRPKSLSLAKKICENAPEEQEESTQSSVSESEPGCRRHSKRLAAQQKAKQVTEEQSCINVDSDSNSDGGANATPKKSSRKKGHVQTLQKTSKSASSKPSPKKPVGKLAPIFAKKKTGDEKESANQPKEDPEVARRRREFLLSGVPSELKRQAVCPVETVEGSDYAPFPDHSHVQQQDSAEPGGVSVWTLAAPDLEARLKKEEESEEFGMEELRWSSLQWPSVVPKENLLTSLSLSAHLPTSVGHEVQGLLLNELQQTNPGFPFSALCDKFRARLSVGALKEYSESEVQKTSSDSDIVIVDDLEDTSVAVQNDRDSQWPESLQPQNISELVGNEGSLRRLKYWLEEWKVLIQREATESAKSAGGKDSDFDFSEEDSDDCSHLCNTVLLVGPHGVGKTAAVYALADQLSYKVFEVSASSSRQGRHILAQLQEATQSHQVAQKKDGIVPSQPLPAPATQRSQSTEQLDLKKTTKKAANAIPKAFANFLKKADPATEGKKTPKKQTLKKEQAKTSNSHQKADGADVKKETCKRMRPKDVEVVESGVSRKKRRGDNKAECSVVSAGSAQDVDEGNMAGHLNLMSTSLILFDEVDLVFEEDSGFLQTVQHFINTTKIPIIMTTSHPGFARCINARFETLLFTAPSMASLTSYLQTVCLAIGMRTCPDDIRAVAGLCGGDVRCALLTLQFLALSRGSRTQKPQAFVQKSAKQTPCSEGRTQHGTASTKQCILADSDSDEDFVSLKPLRKKARRIVDEDDSSSVQPTTSAALKVGAASDDGGKTVDVTVDADRLPPVHLHLYQSLLGVSCDLQDILINCIKGECNASLLQLLSQECLKLKSNNIDILQANILRLLPLPQVAMPGRWQRPCDPSSRPVKRKRIRSDLFDSDASDDENVSKASDTDTKAADAATFDKKDASDVVSGYSEECSSKETKQETDKAQCADEATEENMDNYCETASQQESCCEQESVGAAASLNTVTDASCEGSQTPDPKTAEETGNTGPRVSLRGSRPCTDGGLGSKLLSSFSDFYDSLSAMDCGKAMESQLPGCSKGRCDLLPGIEDCVSSHPDIGTDEVMEEMQVEVTAHCSRQLWQRVEGSVSAWKHDNCSESIPDNCRLPLESPGTSLLAMPRVNPAVRVPDSYQTVVDSVVSSLPLTSHLNMNAVTLDYLPTLRAISQAERCRQVAKTKRRFHHHFDSIGMGLDKSTVAALCNDFPPVQSSP